MKIFHYNPPNTFAKKVYTVSKVNEDTTHIKVESPFLGKWSFDLNMTYQELIEKLTEYSSGKSYIQNVFPNLAPSQREKFLSDPSLWSM